MIAILEETGDMLVKLSKTWIRIKDLFKYIVFT